MKPVKIATTNITLRETKSFVKYLKEVSDIKPFDGPEEEYECALKAWNGDVKAKEELIRRNLRFVISCAKQYVMKGASLEDLVNEGNIGISTAADRFDPTTGFKFISYAVWYIRRDILAFLSNSTRTIRIPINKVEAINKYRIRVENLEQQLQRPVIIDDILDVHDDYNEYDIQVLSELSKSGVTSLDSQFSDEDSSNTLYELIPDNSMGRTDDLTIKSDMDININTLTSILTDMDKDIIVRFYGLDGEAPETLTSIGLYYEISKESVRQRRDKALRLIKRTFKNDAKILFE